MSGVGEKLVNFNKKSWKYMSGVGENSGPFSSPKILRLKI